VEGKKRSKSALGLFKISIWHRKFSGICDSSHRVPNSSYYILSACTIRVYLPYTFAHTVRVNTVRIFKYDHQHPYYTRRGSRTC
jgi:hypothetical protein